MLKETKPTTHSTNNVLHTHFSLTTCGYTSHPSQAHGHLHAHHAHFRLMHTPELCFHHYTHHCSLLTLPTSPMMATLFMPTISKITHIYHLSHPCNATILIFPHQAPFIPIFQYPLNPFLPPLHGHAWPHKPLQMSPPFPSIPHSPFCPSPCP